jgi:hypothetical protein
MQADSPNFWRDLVATVWERVVTPARHPKYVIYFLGIIVVVGALGVIIPLVRNFIAAEPTDAEWRSVLHSLCTYVLAILAAALADSIVSEKIKSTLRLLIFVFALLVAGAAITVLFIQSLEKGWMIVGVATVVALFLWWVANADNANLLEPTPAADAAIGGPIQTP